MKNLTRFFTPIACLLFLPILTAQNLIDSDDWQVSVDTDNLANYVNNGPISNTYLEDGINPFGANATLWRVDSKINESYTRYYGFKTTASISSQIDPNADYRYTVWVKMLGADASDVTQYGTFSAGVKGVNGYKFISSNGDELTQVQWRSGGNIPSNAINDEWFLLVAYVKGRSSQANLNDGGMYDLTSTIPVGNLAPQSAEFHPTNAPSFEIFTHLRFNPTTDSNDLQSLVFFDPRFEKVEGAPSIGALRNIESGSLVGGVWHQVGSDINYVDGNVGIGVENPDAPLTVKGNIHTNEVLVDIEAPIVPDYVFNEGYDLKTLKEVQSFIKENAHLPNIPSASEMAEDGMELKTMNLKLLEKIEELTLYIIDQENRITVLEQKD